MENNKSAHYVPFISVILFVLCCAWALFFIKIFTDEINPPIRLTVAALRMHNTSEVAGDFSPLVLLLPKFVSCEDSDLRLVGSDSYLAEVFPRYQYRHYNG